MMPPVYKHTATPNSVEIETPAGIPMRVYRSEVNRSLRRIRSEVNATGTDILSGGWTVDESDCVALLSVMDARKAAAS